MRTGKSNYLVLGILSVALLGLSAASRGMYGDGLINDANLLRSGEENTSEFRSVRGATDSVEDNEDGPCPADKPVIGWINYAGERKIRTTLPEGEFASACFETTQEANLAGYEQ